MVEPAVLPEPLHAASALLITTPSGRAKALSPLEVINPGGANLTYDPGPKDGQVNKPIGVKVHARGTGNTDWEGLLIEIKAQDNNGKFVAVTPNQATTNALGIADFGRRKSTRPGCISCWHTPFLMMTIWMGSSG